MTSGRIPPASCRALLLALAFCAPVLAGAAPRERLFPPCSPVAGTVEVVDVRGETPSRRVAAATLQGLVNAGPEASVYLLVRDTDAFWLDVMTKKGQIRGTRAVTPDAFFAAHAPAAAKVFVYDPARPAFMQVMALSWAYGPGEIADTLAALGPEYRAVSLPQYRRLWRAAQGGE